MNRMFIIYIYIYFYQCTIVIMYEILFCEEQIKLSTYYVTYFIYNAIINYCSHIKRLKF